MKLLLPLGIPTFKRKVEDAYCEEKNNTLVCLSYFLTGASYSSNAFHIASDLGY